MVTYVSIGLLFLFVAITAVNYYSRRKRAPSQEVLDRQVRSILKNGERDRL